MGIITLTNSVKVPTFDDRQETLTLAQVEERLQLAIENVLDLCSETTKKGTNVVVNYEDGRHHQACYKFGDLAEAFEYWKRMPRSRASD
jgi:hypothetical protein